MKYGLEVRIPGVNYSTDQGFPYRSQQAVTDLTIQKNMPYAGKKIKMAPSMQPLFTEGEQLEWSVVDGSTYANIDPCTGDLYIKDGTIAQMVKIKAQSVANPDIYSEKEVVLTYKDIDYIGMPEYKINVYGIQDEYVYTGQATTYQIQFEVYPNTVGYTMFEVIQNDSLIEIKNVAVAGNTTTVDFGFKNIVNERNQVVLRIYDSVNPDLQTTAVLNVVARIENIWFMNMPGGNIIPDILYSFDYGTDPHFSRKLDVSIMSNRSLIEQWYTSNEDGTQGTFNFMRKNTDINTAKTVTVRFSDSQNPSVYRDASIGFNVVGQHMINVYGNLALYKNDGSTYSFRWEETPDAGRELNVEVIQAPYSYYLNYSMTDVSGGSGTFNFSSSDKKAQGDYVVRISDPSNSDFYQDVEFKIYNEADIYNYGFIYNHYTYAPWDFWHSYDTYPRLQNKVLYNNILLHGGGNIEIEKGGDGILYCGGNIDNSINNTVQNTIDIQSYYTAGDEDDIKACNIEMYFGVLDYFDKDRPWPVTDSSVSLLNVEVVSRSGIGTNDASVMYPDYRYDPPRDQRLVIINAENVSGSTAQVKIRAYMQYGNENKEKNYTVNIRFIERKNELKYYFSTNIAYPKFYELKQRHNYWNRLKVAEYGTDVAVDTNKFTPSHNYIWTWQDDDNRYNTDDQTIAYKHGTGLSLFIQPIEGSNVRNDLVYKIYAEPYSKRKYIGTFSDYFRVNMADIAANIGSEGFIEDRNLWIYAYERNIFTATYGSRFKITGGGLWTEEDYDCDFEYNRLDYINFDLGYYKNILYLVSPDDKNGELNSNRERYNLEDKFTGSNRWADNTRVTITVGGDNLSNTNLIEGMYVASRDYGDQWYDGDYSELIKVKNTTITGNQISFYGRDSYAAARQFQGSYFKVFFKMNTQCNIYSLSQANYKILGGDSNFNPL